MPIPVTFFIGCQLSAMLISCIVGLIGVLYLRRALLREIAAVGTEQWSPEVYLRFIATRARIEMAVQRVNVVIAMIMLLGIVALAFSFVPFRNLVLISPSIWALFAGFIIGVYISSVVKAIFVDREVWLRIAQESSLRRNGIFALAIKNFLFNRLPALLFLEVWGILLLLMEKPIIFLYWFLLFTVSKVITDLLFTVPFFTWIALLHPIEQTQWAALAPRINNWARLAGVEFASVLVQRGGIGFDLIGLGRPTLIISETFLRYSEWRQQDALIGIVIGLVRKHIVRRNFLSGMLFIGWLVAFAVTFSLPASSFGPTQGVILLVYLILFCGMAIVFQRPLYAACFYADRLAVLLTGDPGAVIVALNTMQALSGLPATRPLASNLPRTSERIKKLKKLAQQSWQIAPQSTTLVPAITEASLGSYNLTTSLTQADTPGPVPSAPYADLAKA
jgi:Zn-dependent protease with chaperone function